MIRNESGLYFYLVFPIAFAFFLTFAGARIVSHLAPNLYLTLGTGFHIHHFAYGFFVLAVSGYLALIFNGPRATYLIALLHGFGLGLAFDEFAMWLKLSDDTLERWNYDGFLIILALFFILISAKRGIRALESFWPLNKLR